MAAAKRGGYLWLDYCEPGREDLSTLIPLRGLHPAAIEDCTDDNQLPKIDDDPHHTFMLFNSLLNNQMALAANQTNATVRRLTFITTIFMPLTLLAGFGGMSEWSMMTGPQNWRLASVPAIPAGDGCSERGQLLLPEATGQTPPRPIAQIRARSALADHQGACLFNRKSKIAGAKRRPRKAG